METRLLRVGDISRDDEYAWRGLGERALESNPFAGPDFFLASARHFAGYAGARVLIAQEGPEFRGVLPMAGIDTPRIPPRRLATVRGRPTAVSALQTPLVDPRDPDGTVDALVRALEQAAKDGDWPGIVLFDEIGTDGPVAGALRRVCLLRHCPIFVKDSWERAMVTRAGRWATPVDGKRGREIGRLQRKLVREAGAEVTVVDHSLDPGVCEEFLEMENAGWKSGEKGQAFARFPDLAAWFRDWHVRSPAGRFTVLSLDVGSTPVAMHYFVRSGRGIFCFRMAFDEAYAQYSPGTIALVMAMAHLYEHTDAEWIDSATHKGNSHMLDLLPERKAMAQLFVGTGGRLDRAMVSALPAMTALASAKRKMAHRPMADQKIVSARRPAPPGTAPRSELPSPRR